MTALRLIVFDVDGTLVDSQADILGSMAAAFSAEGLDVPEREAVLGIVGLSLDVAMTRLAPEADRATHDRLVEGYKHAYMTLRKANGSAQSSPLYPGARTVLDHLAGVDHYLLGVATGKSRRGLDALLQGHGLERMFVTQQVADHHPSKPHPAMLHSAMAETGIAPEAAVMIGDTSFDMEMARAAGMAAIGVSWGYHDREALSAADVVIDDFAALPQVLRSMWG